MDYEKLIDNNDNLKDYFKEFPKKLKQLATEGKFIKFFKNGIQIDIIELSEYLTSKSSVFPIDSIKDFMETLHVLQFSKVSNARSKILYCFINPNFGEDKVINDDFYKQPIDITKINLLKGTKRIIPTRHIELFDRLIQLNGRSKIKISQLEYSRLKLKFALQKHYVSIKCQQDTIEHNIDEPEYIKKNEIAGYYGNVELTDLKNIFCNYFPIYANGNEIEMEIVQEPVRQTPEMLENEDIGPQTTIEPNENQNHMVVEDVLTSQLKESEKEVASSKQNTIVLDDFKENEPPLKKRRKCVSQSAKITTKETNDALTNLQKEFGASFLNNAE